MAEPAKQGELVGTKLGKYELLALLAVGGTAEIYLARICGASGFEKYLVVKCLLAHLADDQDFVRMFLDEARVSAQLDHSNIVQTLELGEHNGQYFLVMEYLAGMSLAQLARSTQQKKVNGGLIGTNRVLGLSAQACSGLQYAHTKTIQGKALDLVHRDISPQNLVVCYEGILKVVDFGIAKSSIKEVHTQIGTIKGKFAYMSPEQCLAKKLDHRTDIFALGTLTHELLTGRRLFKRKNPYDTYHAIVNGKVPPPSKINPQLGSDVDDVIMKALAYKAEDRYQSSREFGAALLSLVHARGGNPGTSDVARFFDEHFSDELDEHAAKMRELITGTKSDEPEASWDSDLEGTGATPAPAAAQGGQQRQRTRQVPATLPPIGGPAPAAPRPRPADPVHPSSRGPMLPEAPDLNVDACDDDEGPTRIEFNPADRVAAMHEHTTDAGDDQWDIPTNLTPSSSQSGPTRSTKRMAATPRPPKAIQSARNQPPQQSRVPQQSRAHPPAASSPPRPSTAAPRSRPPTLSGRNLPPVPAPRPPQAAAPSAAVPRKQNFAAPPETMSVTQMPGGAASMLKPPTPMPPPVVPGQAAVLRHHSASQQVPRSNFQEGAAPLTAAPRTAAPLTAAPRTAAPLAAAPLTAAPLTAAPLAAAPRTAAPRTAALPQPSVPALAPRTPASATPDSASPQQSSAGTPLWMHAAVFIAFVGVGFGIATLLKMFL